MALKIDMHSLNLSKDVISFSIIMVVFNAVKTVEETIKSVIGQSYANLEFIIIDGGSSDGTIQIIQKYTPNITCFISEPDHGIYDAMNKGIKLVQGDFVYFIGADDVFFDDNVLRGVIPYLTQDLGLFYGDVKFKKRGITYDGKFNLCKIVTRNICHQSIFYSRQLFLHYKFNTKYKIFADYDLNLRLFNNSEIQFKYIPLIIAVFNDQGASGLNTVDANFQKDRLSIIKENFPYWVYLYRIIRSGLKRCLFIVNSYE